MKTELRKFIYKIILLSTVLIILSSIIFFAFLSKYYFNSFPFLFIIFIAVSIFTHAILLKSAQNNQRQFNTAFMLSFILKIFAYSIFVGLSLYIDKTNYVAFIITTMIFYAIYTVFDVIQILNYINKNKNNIDIKIES